VKKSRPKVSKPRPATKRSTTRVNRATDKAFKRNNPKTSKRHSRFFPQVISTSGYGYGQTCLKEERLSIHIPAERLDAARFDGFAVILIDNAGEEIPVFVPPNYVEGFRRASGQSAARSPYIAPSYETQPYYGAPNSYQNQQAIPPSPPASSREPIIYGDPNYRSPVKGYN
jgi:hypothetical protein